MCVVMMTGTGRSLDLQKLDVEDQGTVGRNTTHALAAVGLASRNGQATLTTNGHAFDTDVPTLNDLALAQLEGERGSFLVCCVAALASTL